MNPVKFYGANKENGHFSNFYVAPIEIDGQMWLTTEHYYQAQKATNFDDAERIRLCQTPHEAAKIGRRYIQIRPDWDTVKYGVMLTALTAKFTQHPDLRNKLLATGDSYLVEHTVGSVRPDPVWGDGEAGEGKNWLGRLLMLLRDQLK